MRRPSFISILPYRFLSLVALLLLMGRIAYSGQWNYRFFVGNLLLAWIPFVLAYKTIQFYKSDKCCTGKQKRVLFGLFFVWLLFFPNAPYLVTDIIHWRKYMNPFATYDLLMMLAFIVEGILLGMVSLSWMHQIAEEQLGKKKGWLFVAVVALMTGFGIYLGRVERWNSWDIVRHPIGLIYAILQKIFHPIAYPQPVVFTLVGATSLLCIYLIMLTLSRKMSLRPTQPQEIS